VLTRKLGNVGFAPVASVDRAPFGFEALARYPLFAPEFLDFVRAVIPPHLHDQLVYAVVVTARKPLATEGGR
jgi:hypothetical protein